MHVNLGCVNPTHVASRFVMRFEWLKGVAYVDMRISVRRLADYLPCQIFIYHQENAHNQLQNDFLL